MSEQELKTKIKRVLIEGLKLKREPESIPDGDSFFGGGLNLDSVDILTLVTVLEEQFDLRIQDEEVQQLNSVNAIAAFLQRKKGQSQPGA
ncbi:MAG: acyl carrier protein [candidate division FCPU426 bacterium]